MKKIALHEHIAQDKLAVDTAEAIITGVKVLGLESVNRRRYTLEAIQAALPLYEGIRVNIDHPAIATDSRSLRDRFGKLVNVQMQPDGPYANLIYNPAHPLAEAVAWWAQHQPDCLGLSHNAVGEGHEDENGIFVIERIDTVRSVDLVSDPATTKGLYEHKEAMDDEMLNQDQAVDTEPEPDEEENYETHIGHLVVAILQDEEMSKEEKRAKILQALKLLDDDEAEDSEESEDEEKQDEEKDAQDADGDEKEDDEECREAVKILAKSNKHVKRLLKSYEHVRAENKARKLCEAARIPATEVFVDSLVRAKNEKAMKELIEDRKAIVNKPRSRAAGATITTTVEEFARKVKG